MLNFFILVNLVILGPLIIYGIIIAFINNKISGNLHNKRCWWIYTIASAIGTPIHELSHLIFNLIFFHKVTKVELYRPIKSKKDGVLGFVDFSYNKASLYQNIGLFFTGIGPMIGGFLVLFILMKILLPDVFNEMKFISITNLNFLEVLTNIKDNTISNFTSIFTKYNSFQNLVIFLVLAFSISTHMHISTQDLKVATTGFVILEIVFLIISILLLAFKLDFITPYLIVVSSYMLSFFTIGLLFSIISLVFSYIVSFIFEK